VTRRAGGRFALLLALALLAGLTGAATAEAAPAAADDGLALSQNRRR